MLELHKTKKFKQKLLLLKPSESILKIKDDARHYMLSSREHKSVCLQVYEIKLIAKKKCHLVYDQTDAHIIGFCKHFCWTFKKIGWTKKITFEGMLIQNTKWYFIVLKPQ